MRACPVCQGNYSDDMDFCPRDATRLLPAVLVTEFELGVGLSGRYHVLRRIGEGGMGTVFLAEQIAVGNRSVALKILRRTLLQDADFFQRFRDEAASTGRIRHRNVVTIYECGQTDNGSPYIAMEYLEGESLRQVLKRRGSLPLDVTAEILQQAARGLNAAHKLGIIHRDLKPDNMFVTHDEEGQPLVKILDFGIAKMRESTTHTMTGLALGTPAYMSVEQAAGVRSEEMDGRSDVYSLAIVGYEMIAGCVPFQASSPFEYARKHLTESPPPINFVRPDLNVSIRAEQVLGKALSKAREDRYATVLDFAQEFAKVSRTERAQRQESVETIHNPFNARERQAQEVAEAARKAEEERQAREAAEAAQKTEQERKQAQAAKLAGRAVRGQVDAATRKAKPERISGVRIKGKNSADQEMKGAVRTSRVPGIAVKITLLALFIGSCTFLVDRVQHSTRRVITKAVGSEQNGVQLKQGSSESPPLRPQSDSTASLPTGTSHPISYSPAVGGAKSKATDNAKSPFKTQSDSTANSPTGTSHPHSPAAVGAKTGATDDNAKVPLDIVPQPGQTFLEVAAVQRKEAESVADWLQRKGFRVHAAPKPGNPSIYRVLIGPIKDAADLSGTRDSLRDAGFREIIVQHY